MSNEGLRKGCVYYKGEIAGYIEETEAGYTFLYDKSFLKNKIPISISFPLCEEPYTSSELFSFFKGLLPEGWYLSIVSSTQKIDSKDAFGILLATAGVDTIGAVTVSKVE
jgi:serine/threonine-protein kinase HipA